MQVPHTTFPELHAELISSPKDTKKSGNYSKSQVKFKIVACIFFNIINFSQFLQGEQPKLNCHFYLSEFN